MTAGNWCPKNVGKLWFEERFMKCQPGSMSPLLFFVVIFIFAFYKAFAGNTSWEYLRPSLEEGVLPYPWWKNTSKFMLPSKSSLPPFCANFRQFSTWSTRMATDMSTLLSIWPLSLRTGQQHSKNVIGVGHSLILVWIKGDKSWGQARLDLQCVWQRSGRIHWLFRDPSRSDQVEIIWPHL